MNETTQSPAATDQQIEALTAAGCSYARYHGVNIAIVNDGDNRAIDDIATLRVFGADAYQEVQEASWVHWEVPLGGNMPRPFRPRHKIETPAAREAATARGLVIHYREYGYLAIVDRTGRVDLEVTAELFGDDRAATVRHAPWIEYRNGRPYLADIDLQCDQEHTCGAPVAMIDDKGWGYCAPHGEARRGPHRVRQLTDGELARLKRGQTIKAY